MYHVTQKYLGLHPLLKPYIPMAPVHDENVEVKRICVAPNVVDALMGKAGYAEMDKTILTNRSEVFVYKAITGNPIIADTPDQLDFNEYWYTEPTLFTYVGKLQLISNGVIEVGFEVEDHRKLMVPHHISYFAGEIDNDEFMLFWREEAQYVL